MRCIAFLMALLSACFSSGNAAEPKGVPSIAYGGGGCGKLEEGEALPCSGDNYEAFASTACALGRNYLHPLVTKTVVEAFGVMAKELPKRQWQYGDLGWEEGGSFRPHKTHQNGLAADFFVPVNAEDGSSALVPISVFNKFGYDVEFDQRGHYEDLSIDWRALTSHLIALETVGAKHGVTIKRVILTPEFQKLLLKADPRATRFQGRFSRRRSWVRHDEHYHVDFELPKRFRRPLKCN